MALWQIDIVGGVFLVDGTEVKVVTGVDDHSRFCVIATVVRARDRAGGVSGVRRRRCAATASRTRSSPITASSSPTGSARAARCCSTGSAATTPSSTASPSPRHPTTTGKVERFHQTLRRELLDRPRARSSRCSPPRPRSTPGSPNTTATARTRASDIPAMPVDRFAPSQHDREHADRLLPLRLPALLEPVATTDPAPTDPATDPQAEPVVSDPAEPVAPAYRGGPVEFERVVPALGQPRRRAASSSGSDRPRRESRSPSGPTTTSSTCSSPAPGSRPSARTCPRTTSPPWPPPAAAPPDRHRCHLPSPAAPRRGRPGGQPARPDLPGRPPRSWPRRSSAAAGSASASTAPP